MATQKFFRSRVDQLSRAQEKDFNQQYDISQLMFVRAGLSIALISYAIYALSDSFAAPGSQEALSILRFTVICPVLGLFLALTWYKPYAALGQKIYTVHMTTMGYFHLTLLSLLKPEDPGFTSYFSGLILITCGLGILGGLRTKYATITGVLILTGYQVVGIYIQDLLSDKSSAGMFVVNNLFLFTGISFGILASYLLETYSKNNYAQSNALNESVSALQQSEKELKATLHDQLEWSNLFTRFIKHELSNSVTGASTSLQMIARKTDHEDTLVYVKRADKCLKDLRELLNKASEATSIDDAFRVNEKELVSINELIDELVSQYKLSHNITINVDSQAQLLINGSYLLLNQMFRNLFDNAIRHSLPNKPVVVTICAKRTVAIENEGDPLPEHIENLFELGQRPSSENNGLFGLGLYVVKKIALVHSAHIIAETLDNMTGARFVIQFPTLNGLNSTE